MENNEVTTTFRQFNLKEAKAGKSVCTKEGKPVRIISFDKRGLSGPIVALVKNYEDEEMVCLYTAKGECITHKRPELTLCMTPEKKTMWANIYRNKANNYVFGELYPTKEIAIESKAIMERSYVATVKVEWEE